MADEKPVIPVDADKPADAAQVVDETRWTSERKANNLALALSDVLPERTYSQPETSRGFSWPQGFKKITYLTERGDNFANSTRIVEEKREYYQERHAESVQIDFDLSGVGTGELFDAKAAAAFTKAGEQPKSFVQALEGVLKSNGLIKEDASLHVQRDWTDNKGVKQTSHYMEITPEQATEKLLNRKIPKEKKEAIWKQISEAVAPYHQLSEHRKNVSNKLESVTGLPVSNYTDNDGHTIFKPKQLSGDEFATLISGLGKKFPTDQLRVSAVSVETYKFEDEFTGRPHEKHTAHINGTALQTPEAFKTLMTAIDTNSLPTQFPAEGKVIAEILLQRRQAEHQLGAILGDASSSYIQFQYQPHKERYVLLPGKERDNGYYRHGAVSFDRGVTFDTTAMNAELQKLGIEGLTLQRERVNTPVYVDAKAITAERLKQLQDKAEKIPNINSQENRKLMEMLPVMRDKDFEEHEKRNTQQSKDTIAALKGKDQLTTALKELGGYRLRENSIELTFQEDRIDAGRTRNYFQIGKLASYGAATFDAESLSKDIAEKTGIPQNEIGIYADRQNTVEKRDGIEVHDTKYVPAMSVAKAVKLVEAIGEDGKFKRVREAVIPPVEAAKPEAAKPEAAKPAEAKPVVPAPQELQPNVSATPPSSTKVPHTSPLPAAARPAMHYAPAVAAAAANLGTQRLQVVDTRAPVAPAGMPSSPVKPKPNMATPPLATTHSPVVPAPESEKGKGSMAGAATAGVLSGMGTAFSGMLGAATSNNAPPAAIGNSNTANNQPSVAASEPVDPEKDAADKKKKKDEESRASLMSNAMTGGGIALILGILAWLAGLGGTAALGIATVVGLGTFGAMAYMNSKPSDAAATASHTPAGKGASVASNSTEPSKDLDAIKEAARKGTSAELTQTVPGKARETGQGQSQ